MNNLKRMIHLNITGHSVEKLVDPFGLLSGDRYEFFLDLDVDEEDELYSDKGIGLRAIFVSDENGDKITNFYLYEQGSEKVLDFDLEEDEEELILAYCKDNAKE
jgi:hypothetical protein